MQHRYWVGGAFILFGIYFLLQQMGMVVPVDFTLIVGLAFVAGYFVRKPEYSRDAFPLLAIGSIPLALFSSAHIDDLLPMLSLPSHNNTFLMFLGLFLMASWGIETGMSGPSRRTQWALYLGGFLTLLGGYSFIARLLHVSPAFLSSLIFPVILIGIGFIIISRNFREKKL